MTERLALPRRLLALLLLAGLASAATARGASSAPATTAETPRFSADSSSVEATDELEWRIGFVVSNPSALGLFLDSLICEIEDLGPGETRAERTAVVDATVTVKTIESISAGESGHFDYTGPALAEHAKLTFRLKAHRADSIPCSLSAVVEVLPGPVSRAHPSVFLEVAGKRVETVFFPAARDSGLAPGLLLVHGHANHARMMLRSARIFALRGYTVMLASMPGYGQSDGPPDFMGPATVRALAAALDRLKSAPGVDPNRLAAWGVSRGATAVTLLAEQRGDLRAVIAQSGIYDLWAASRGTKIPGIREVIVQEAGRDSAAWRARSPALDARKPAAAFLILHGEKDGNAPAAQAHGFAESLKARGAEVESRFFPESEHALPRGDVFRAVVDFLRRHLGD